MICIFCQQKCSDQLGVCYNPTNQCSDVSYNCKTCRAEFVVEERRRHQSVQNTLVHYWLHHDKYRLSISVKNKNCRIEQKIVGGLLGNNPDSFIWDVVIELDHIPAHVTPQNLEERIKTLLLFL
jgi:hypothetical protein